MSKSILKLLESAVESKAFSGAAFVYGSSLGIAGRGTVGTLEWNGDDVQNDSMWDLASVSKPLCMLPLMRLLELGELCLDDTIAFFLPDYSGTDKADITLFELLTHTSGIPGQQPLYHRATTPEAMKEAVRQLPLRNPRSTHVEYSSQGFMILGDIIEAVYGARLDIVMNELLFQPLDLQETMFNPPNSLYSRIAATEDCPWRGTIVRGQVHDENCVVLEGIAGHAGLFGTTSDLSLICQMLLRGGETKNGAYLNTGTVSLMTRNHTQRLNLARTLGWQGKDRHGSPAGDLFSCRSFGHTGFTGTSMWMDPEQDMFAILLTNRVHPSRKNEGIKRIRTLFHNLVAIELSTSGKN